MRHSAKPADSADLVDDFGAEALTSVSSLVDSCARRGPIVDLWQQDCRTNTDHEDGDGDDDAGVVGAVRMMIGEGDAEDVDERVMINVQC